MLNSASPTYCGKLGRFDEAHRAFETAIGIDRKKIAAYYGLGVSKRFAADDPHLAALEALARQPSSLSEDDGIFLHFGLGKAYDDLGQHERSFRHLLEGNRMERRQLVYDEAKALAFMDRCRDFFTPDLLRGKAGHGDPSRVPLFIVGMMRSGSTLVEQILASHPQVFGGGERPLFEKFLIATLLKAPEFAIPKPTSRRLARSTTRGLARLPRATSVPSPRLRPRQRA